MIDVTREKQGIVGSWRLQSYVLTLDNGETIPLWGDRADGIIIYLDNGYMSVHVSNQDREKFVENDFLRGNHEEIKEAFEGYTTYFGTYEYIPEEGTVLHHVSESLYPNWSGVTHTRFVEYDDEQLMIRTPPIYVNQKECVMELKWTRL